MTKVAFLLARPHPNATYSFGINQSVGSGTCRDILGQIRLQAFVYPIPFPTLRKFILSVTHNIHLGLFDIPRSGYTSADSRSIEVLPALNRHCRK